VHSESAWLLTASANCTLAIGRHEMIEVLSRPRPFSVPTAPDHCRQLIVWRGQLLPLMRLSLLMSSMDDIEDQPIFVAVVAYQEAAGEALKYGALALSNVPETIEVKAGPASDPSPMNPAVRNRLLLSCFQHEGSSVLVLDLCKLFTEPPNSYINPANQ